MKESEKLINDYYDTINLNLAISFLTSMIGGLLSAVLMSLIFGQSPLKIYQKIGLPLIIWALFFVIIFLIFFFIFWLIFVKVPRYKELKSLEYTKRSIKKMDKRKIWTIILLILLFLTAILFFVLNLNLIVGISFMVLSVAVYFVNNQKWGDQKRGELGIALFSGLIISLIRDISIGPLELKLQAMYFLGLGAAVLLLMPGASNGEEL